MSKSSPTPVAIIGAGPYGLSIAAHLNAAGVPYRIFGDPMRSWLDMARGMFLKSFGFATNVYTPDGSLGFVEWCRENGREGYEPCAIQDFAEYGLWVQPRVAPGLERVVVENVARRAEGGFDVALATGETFQASSVVVASGLGRFPRVPAELQALPETLASHTSRHHDFAGFAGKDVVVVGAGQSALEAAALLHEQGARVQLLVRGGEVLFSSRMPKKRSIVSRLRAPLTVLGPGLFSWMLETFPFLAHKMPDATRVRWTRTHLGPSGAWWVRERIEGKVPLVVNTRIVSAQERGGRVALRVAEEGKGERELLVDHVVAGSGFEFDVDRLDFLDARLRDGIARIEKAPALARNFESRTVPGLYFVGPISAFSHGPLFRFVAGAEVAAPTVAQAIARGAPAAAAVPGVAAAAS